MGDNPNDSENEESLSEADSQWENYKVEYIWHSIYKDTNRPLTSTVNQLMKLMFARLQFG